MCVRHYTVTGVFVQGVGRAPVSVPALTVNIDAVTEVATPEQLQQAVQEGARHIEVTAHMDLTSLAGALHHRGVLLGVFLDATKSIRVSVGFCGPCHPLCHVLRSVNSPCTTKHA